MQTILSSFDLESNRRSLSLELAHADARLLQDIGLVRAEDGSLRLAEDPAELAVPDLPRQRLKAVFEGLAGFVHWLRSLPLRSPNWHPHFFLRE
jgi:hypothetical protein